MRHARLRGIATLALTCLIFHLSSAQSPCLEFRDGGGPSGEAVSGMGVDEEGATYLTGTFTGSMVLGGQNLVGTTNSHFVAKVDGTNMLVWSVIFSSDLWSGSVGLVLDGQGGVVIVGDFQDTLSFGSCSNIHPGSTDIFVAKLNASDGACQWVSSCSSIGYAHCRAVTIGNNGNIHIAGGFWGYCTFGDTTLHCTGTMSPFVATYTQDGAAIWAAQVIDANGGTYEDVSVDPAGNTIAVGYHGATADFGSGIVLSPSPSRAIIAKYDTFGHPVWARSSWIGSSGDAFSSVGCDPAGGYFALHAGPLGVFKFSSQGDSVWSRTWTPSTPASTYPFEASDGHVWMAHLFTDTLVIGNDSITMSSDTRKFALIEFNGDGDLLNMMGVDNDGLSNEYPLVLTFDAAHDPVVGGLYTCTAPDEPDTVLGLHCHGSSDLFFTRTCSSTGIDQTNEAAASIIFYPNPFTTDLFLRSTNSIGPFGMRIIDLSGRGIWTGRVYAGSGKLPISLMELGIYFIQVTMADGGSFTSRVLHE